MKVSSDQKKSTRKLVPKCSCGLEQEISWGGDRIQYPVFSCPTCGPSKNEWEVWWNKYKDLWKDKENWQNKKDAISCIVGYFCHKYEEFYGNSFSFSYSSPTPFKDKEFTMARRLLAMFEGNAWEVAQYIKWGFPNVVKNPQYCVTGLGFFTKADIAIRFKNIRAQSRVIRRRTPLPKDFLEWCQANHPDIFERQELHTWNDLNGIVTHVKSYGLENVEGFIVEEAIRRRLLISGEDGVQYRKLED
jgi:hypothetical protein